MKRIALYILLLGSIISCEKESNKNNIVATTNIIASSLKEIIGNDVPMVVLMNSETDPHAYQASPNDYKELANAKVIVSNGLHLEGKLHETILETTKSNGSKHLQFSDALSENEIIFEEQTVPDPHIWFDVAQWKKCLTYTVNQLVLLYPEHKIKWLGNLKKYNSKLDACHIETQKKIRSIPKVTKTLITAHDAFSYLSRAYKIAIKPLQGRNTNSEPSIKEVINLSEFIVANKIKAIFVETTVNKKFILSIQESCIQKGHKVVIGGELFSDALGAENTPESTYIGMIEHNTKTICNGLK